ncbi:hypothetical protein ACPBEI_00960 [Latilactobacillus sakei]
MLKVSDAFNSAFAAPDRELRARVTIGKTVYDSDDLTSINYDSGAMTGEQFSIGSTYMNSTKITFSHLVEGLKQLDEVLVEFGVLKPGGAVEYVKMGTFIVDDKIQMDRNNNTTTIECMDRMTMLGGIYVSKLTYPARIKDVAIEIANMAGVKVNETSFARLSENKINQPTGYTYRDAIGLIAQFQMGFALFDRDGLLDIRTLQDNSFKIDPNQYFLKGLVKNETFFKLNGISCTVVTTSKDENGNETSKTTVLQSGSSSGAQIKLANNVMTQDVLDRMYEALKFTNYYPFSLNWNGNPAVEAGDWLTVEDLQGNEFKVPNMSYTITYNGGLTAASKADTSVSSPATYSYGGTISNIVNEIGGREGADGNHIYEGTEDQKPLFPKEGDLWYKHVGPDTEERIYKDGKWEFLTSTKTANDAQKAADQASKEAEEAKKQANKAVDGANEAVAKAGFANDTADQAKSDAATATQNATTALTNAGTALTNAKNALDNVNKLDQTVKTEVTNINGQLSQKVNQTTFDTLKGTVTSQGTLINQNKAEIQLKADLSLVNTIKQTVTNNTAAIDLNSKEIKLKASRSDVDKLGGRVTNAEAQIKLQADQIKLTVSKTELTNILGDYATQTWTQSQIKSTADQINLSVSKVQTNLDNMQVGGVNYLRNSNFEFGNANWRVWSPNTPPTGSTVEFQKAGGDWPQGTKGIVKIVRPTAHANNSYGIAQDGISVVQGREYVVSFESASTIDMTFSVGDSGNGFPFQWFHVHALSHQRTQIVFKAPAGATKCNVYFGFNGNDKGTLWISRIMMSQGNKSLDWGVNPADYTSEVQFSQLQLTVNGIQGTVQNKADKSQVTQLANQITSTIESIGTSNWVYNSDFASNSLAGWIHGDYYVSEVTASMYNGTRGAGINKNYGAAGAQQFVVAKSKHMPHATVGETFYYECKIKLYGQTTSNVDAYMSAVSYNGNNETVLEYTNSNVVNTAYGTDKWLTLKGTFKLTKAHTHVNLWFQVRYNGVGTAHLMYSRPMMSNVNGAPYTSQGPTASEITQLASDINLRVQKGDVINQINISPESILIAGQKVHITGQTSIDNAVIKDAMIANVKADKITAGTINAANINVINLNANNMTTGTLKGANLSMNLNTGQVVFQKGRIHSTSNNVDVNIDQGYLSVANGNTRVLLKNGGIQFVQPTIFDETTNPYLSISNGGSGLVFSGARIVGRDYVVMANNANSSNVFDSPLGGAESFAGISAGYDGSSWHPTKIGGADRGIILSAGKKLSSAISWVGGSASIRIGSDGSSGWNSNRIELIGEYVHSLPTYVRTASGSANVIVAADGALVRSTSASKYKTDIIRTNIPDYGEKLLELPTATWMDIAETKRYRDDPVNQIKPTRNFGMIAEDLAEAGLEMLVVRGADGELEGINYDRIGPALIPVIAKLKNEVETLKQKLEEKTA